MWKLELVCKLLVKTNPSTFKTWKVLNRTHIMIHLNINIKSEELSARMHYVFQIVMISSGNLESYVRSPMSRTIDINTRYAIESNLQPYRRATKGKGRPQREGGVNYWVWTGDDGLMRRRASTSIDEHEHWGGECWECRVLRVLIVLRVVGMGVKGWWRLRLRLWLHYG